MRIVRTRGFPSDAMVRWLIQSSLQLTRRGKNFQSGPELDDYLTGPAFENASYPPLKFVFSSTADANFSKASGETDTLGCGQSGRVVQIHSGKRKGVKIDLSARKKIKVACNTAKPDYSADPAHPFFILSNSALPQNTPQCLIDTARKAFSCSIKRQTQSNYVTGVNHLKKCEALCGRTFSSPMSEEDKLCYTSYLVSKGLKSESIQNYLTHIKFYELSMGVQNPVKGSQLNSQILQGLKNLQRNPREAVFAKTRRPITPAMIKLLSHSLAMSGFSNFELSLRWSVILVAFWGSFRQGCGASIITSIKQS